MTAPLDEQRGNSSVENKNKRDCSYQSKREHLSMSETSNTSASPRSTGRIVLRNALFSLGAQAALRVASFLFNVFVIRTLGGEQFGQYQIVLDWAGLFAVIGDLGITQYLAREIARDRSKTAEVFWDTVVLRLVLSILAAVVTVIAAAGMTDYSIEIIVGIVLFTAGYLFQAFMVPLNSVLVGNERVDISSVLELVMQVLFWVLAGIVLFLGLDFRWLLVASLVNFPLNMVLQLWVFRRNRISLPAFQLHREAWWSLFKAGLPFALIQISLSFAFRFDTVILSGRVPDQQVGWYKSAYNLILTFVTFARTFSSIPMRFDPGTIVRSKSFCFLRCQWLSAGWFSLIKSSSHSMTTSFCQQRLPWRFSSGTSHLSCLIPYVEICRPPCSGSENRRAFMAVWASSTSCSI
jgi:hypothetical protein